MTGKKRDGDAEQERRRQAIGSVRPSRRRPSRDRTDAGPTAGGGREGGDWPRRAAIGPVDPYLCGLRPDLNCGLLAQPAMHGARGIGARARPDAVRSFRAFNRLRAVGERLFQAAPYTMSSATGKFSGMVPPMSRMACRTLAPTS
jgi:hypothetical protein